MLYHLQNPSEVMINQSTNQLSNSPFCVACDDLFVFMLSQINWRNCVKVTSGQTEPDKSHLKVLSTNQTCEWLDWNDWNGSKNESCFVC